MFLLSSYNLIDVQPLLMGNTMLIWLYCLSPEGLMLRPPSAW